MRTKTKQMNNTAKLVNKLLKKKGLTFNDLPALLGVGKHAVYVNSYYAAPSTQYTNKLMALWPEEAIKILTVSSADKATMPPKWNKFALVVFRLKVQDHLTTQELAKKLNITKAYMSFNHTKVLSWNYVKAIMALWPDHRDELWEAALQSQMRLNIILTAENTVLLKDLFKK